VRQADSKPDVRGIAVKLLGVPGRKLIPGLEAATTQDFLAILSPTTPFRNAQEFVGLLLAADNQALLLPRLAWQLGPFRAVRIPRSSPGSAGQCPRRATLLLAADR
jgi:hypothetical protein